MLQVANSELRVDILDPTRDADLLGPRFCAGAFVWQVHDLEKGPMLSGPEGPEPKPDPFNGHGLPEACRDRSRSGHQWLWQGDEGFAPGVGTLGRNENGVIITQPATWHLDIGPTRAEFRSRHQAAGYDAELVRILELDDRTLRSQSELTNHGPKTMELEWFAHPFFALDAAGGITIELPATASLPADAGFILTGNRLTPARRYHGQEDGAFVLLEGIDASPLAATISHPKLADGIRFSTDFAPSECPIWMNGFTFSIEPYQRLMIPSQAAQTWQLTYQFGR